MVSAKREAETELESIHQERMQLEKNRHQLTMTPPSHPSSRPPSRNTKNSQESLFPSTVLNSQTKIDNEAEIVDEDLNKELLNNSQESLHSFMIGYLPPEKEPPPFKGNYKKKIPKL